MIIQNRHRKPAKQVWRSRLLDCFVILFLAMTSLSFPVFAEDKKEETTKEAAKEPAKETPKKAGSLYSPEFCDFEITFPEKPQEAERCPPSIDKCYKITNYVMVYDVSASVDISATCVPSTPENFKRYNKQVIDNVLKGMAQRAELKTGNVNTVEEDGVRKGSLLGSGSYGKQEQVYNAQIWIGPRSIMTVEARLIGSEHELADAAYTDIIKSIQKKQAASETPAEPTEDKKEP